MFGRSFEQGGIFIVPHLLWLGARFFRSHLKDRPIQSPLTTHEGCGGSILTWILTALVWNQGQSGVLVNERCNLSTHQPQQPGSPFPSANRTPLLVTFYDQADSYHPGPKQERVYMCDDIMMSSCEKDNTVEPGNHLIFHCLVRLTFDKPSDCVGLSLLFGPIL
jgi:hypothetical protein